MSWDTKILWFTSQLVAATKLTYKSPLFLNNWVLVL